MGRKPYIRNKEDAKETRQGEKKVQKRKGKTSSATTCEGLLLQTPEALSHSRLHLAYVTACLWSCIYTHTCSDFRNKLLAPSFAYLYVHIYCPSMCTLFHSFS